MDDVNHVKREFNNRLKWKVYNNEFTNMRVYTYNFFKYMVEIDDPEILKAFIDLVTQEDNVLPVSICNFFLDRSIPYKLKFHYLKEAPIIDNLQMFIYIQRINMHKANILFRKVYVFERLISKENIGGKIRKKVFFKVANLKKDIVWFLELDLAIKWLPKIIKRNSESAFTICFVWLLMIVGYTKLKKQPDIS